MIIITNEIMREKVDKLLENANELFLKKKFKDAILLYDEILKLDAENLNVINNKGYALSKIKNYDDAIAQFDRCIAIDDKFAIAYSVRGMAKGSNKNLKVPNMGWREVEILKKGLLWD
jgi:tetratricopeptide (TPR) repeat protein